MTVKRNIVLLALTVAWLSGCAASFGYNRLDWLIPWYVDGYVDLSGEQRDALRGHLEPRLAWHREEELARYLALLETIEQDLAGEVSPERVRAWTQSVIDAAVRLERNMIEVGLAFGEDISEPQMREFVDSLWERQREFEEEFLDRSDARYFDDDYDKLESLLERFLGRLTADQEDALRQASRGLQRFDRAWLEEREGWLNRLQPVLLERADGWQQQVMQDYEARLRLRTPDYHATLDHNVTRISQAIAAVIGMMTEKQHKHARKELDDLRETLRDLMQHESTALNRGTWRDLDTTRNRPCNHWA